MPPFDIKIPKQKAKKKEIRKKNRSFLATFLRILLISILWLIMIGGFIVLWLIQELPDIKQLQVGQRRPSVTIQSENGTILGSYGDLHEEVVKLNELPAYVPQALMAVEDRRFYYHFGIDVIGLFRAFIRNYSAGRVVQGGSTITQQLAKNFLFTQGIFPHNDRSYKRKIQEVLLAIWLEWNFSKNQILTIYLNRVYLGTGTYGIEAAAQRYFQKSARELTVFESALIAGLLQAPSRFSPANNIERSQKRAQVVLCLMEEAGFITNAQKYLKAGIQELKDLKLREVKGYRYFTDWVYESITDYLGTLDQDIIVVTTLDTTAQQHAEHIVEHYINTFGKNLKVSQGAFLAMRPSGAIVSMVGGRSYVQSQFNRVTHAMRQPGSAIKPFVYLTAIEEGMTPDTMIEDTLIQIGKWSPKNYKYIPQGQVPLAVGLIKSINSVTIRLAQAVGARKIIDTVHRLGVLSDIHPDLSIALGTMEMPLLELVSAFGAFANNGYLVTPFGVLEIRDKRGKILYSYKRHKSEPVIEKYALDFMKNMLQRVVREGTARRCNIDDTMMAKTGSNGDKDAYFIGSRGGKFEEDDITQGVKGVIFGAWVGNDDFSDMHKSSLGGNIPLRMTKAFLLGKIPPEDCIKCDPRKPQEAQLKSVQHPIEEKTLDVEDLLD
jgi:penicillin-binding protein 1A